MLYFKALKAVHPDLNSTVHDPAEKIMALQLHRNDDNMISNLLKTWGISLPTAKVSVDPCAPLYNNKGNINTSKCSTIGRIL